jgi:hypothetical protein
MPTMALEREAGPRSASPVRGRAYWAGTLFVALTGLGAGVMDIPASAAAGVPPPSQSRGQKWRYRASSRVQFLGMKVAAQPSIPAASHEGGRAMVR